MKIDLKLRNMARDVESGVIGVWTLTDVMSVEDIIQERVWADLGLMTK